jgi:hypothetical protein
MRFPFDVDFYVMLFVNYKLVLCFSVAGLIAG